MRSLLYPDSVYSNISLLYTKSAYSNIFLELTPYIVTYLFPQKSSLLSVKSYSFLELHKCALIYLIHRKIRSFTVNFVFLQSIIFCKTWCYYIRCKYNKQTTIGSQKICYYKRIVTIYDVTISGLKCITEIGKLQGPSIYCYYMRIVTISGVTIYGLQCNCNYQ